MISDSLNPPTPISQTVSLYWRSTVKGWFHRLWARFVHQPIHLLNLAGALCCNSIQNSHYIGIHPVPIDQIHGSEGKGDAFDARFFPTKEISRNRWLNIAAENLRGHVLPPVELVEVDGEYYVRDGHHRISVARCLGQAYIEAEITKVRLACCIR